MNHKFIISIKIFTLKERNFTKFLLFELILIINIHF